MNVPFQIAQIDVAKNVFATKMDENELASAGNQILKLMRIKQREPFRVDNRAESADEVFALFFCLSNYPMPRHRMNVLYAARFEF